MKIVAPAGNMERFYSAVNAGADEIYMGLKGFGARRNAENFTLEEFKQALDYAHERGTRIFLTLNTLMKNVEIEFLYQNFKALYEHGLDAVIVQDLGYFRFLKENFPNIDYHGSTQMTAANHVEADYLKSLGFKRVVLPREMSFEEIKKLKEIGINSIKIEGRMKEKTYVHEAVTYFKNLIDGINAEERVSSIFNRGYSKGYFYENRGNIMNKNYPANMGKPIGIISGKELLLEENVMLGDGIIYLSKDYETLGGDYINRIEKKNKKEKFKTAQKGEKIILINAPKGAKYVFKNYDKNVNDDIESKLKNSGKKKEISLEFIGKEGELPVLKACAVNNRGEKISAEIKGENPVEKAAKRGAEKENIIEKLSETGETVFKVKDCNVYIDNNIFLPLSVLKQMRRDVLEDLRIKLVESHRRILGEREIFRIPVEKDKPKNCEISVMVTNEIQEKTVRELGIKKIYRRGFDVARENNLEKINLNEKLATNLYQVLENKNSDVTVGWNLNVGNIYSLNEYGKIPNVETVIITPELNFEQIENIGKVPVRKALLGYSKLKGMYIELPIFKDGEIITNEQGDNFVIRKNELGNDEIYFEKPLNVLSQVKRLGKIGIDEVIIELFDETPEEIKFILENIDKKENSYSPYNYERGVF